MQGRQPRSWRKLYSLFGPFTVAWLIESSYNLQLGNRFIFLLFNIREGFYLARSGFEFLSVFPAWKTSKNFGNQNCALTTIAVRFLALFDELQGFYRLFQISNSWTPTGYRTVDTPWKFVEFWPHSCRFLEFWPHSCRFLEFWPHSCRFLEFWPHSCRFLEFYLIPQKSLKTNNSSEISLKFAKILAKWPSYLDL